MPTGPSLGTLGTLTLVKRKGGTDVQTFPLDAERITFGRDYDCDVRLYYSDVSKLHCEINFDLMSGQANLRVHGSNGLLHTPQGGTATSYKPPATISLANKDIITIRKKPFRFEYGPLESSEADILSPAMRTSTLPDSAASPAKPLSPATTSPAGQPVRRRASHRLSLVPAGKSFMPLSPAKNRRHSSLGLGGMGVTAKMSSNKSKLSEEIQEEEANDDNEEEVEQSVVGVTNGDEGDMVYLEMNEETKEEATTAFEPQAIHNNPFMTPQQTRKAPLRNTSAVPRTRKINGPTNGELVEKMREESRQPAGAIVTMPETPRTPRSVPLPATSDTPYNPPTTPLPQRLPTTPVPAHVAMATPKGPATLRKALLLRSARRVWQETRATGVEGAIQSGEIVVRRKSLSPKTKASNKTVASVQDPRSESSSDEEEAEPEIEEHNHAIEELQTSEEVQVDGQLQWIHEDGTAEVSFDSDSSGVDSQDADMSLDIPGQTVLHLTPTGLESEEEYINNFIEDGVDGEQFEEYDEDLKVSDEEEAQDSEDPDEENDMATSLPGTPVHRPIATNRFFTPQPQRSNFKQPRRSLAEIGGPAVRFERLPATPGSLRGVRAAPGSMGKPSRRVTMAVPDEDDDDDGCEVEVKKQRAPMTTPRKSAAILAEDQRRQEALATPRILPAPPASGFKSPVRETRFGDLVATPSHPALAPRSPEIEQSEHRAVPSTPMGDIKKRLDSMRRQSVQRQATLPADRRATIGLAGTPISKPVFTQGASYSVAPRRRFTAQPPRTPIFPPFKRESAETSVSLTPAPINLAEKSPEDRQATPKAQTPSSPETEPPSSPSTPSFTGLRQMLNPVVQMKTPHLAGIRNMFPATPKNSASPSLAGVKNLLAEPIVPATPSFAGMRSMFTEQKILNTPGMEGLADMYEEEEDEKNEEEEEEEEIEVAMEVALDVEEEQEEIEEARTTLVTSAGRVAASKLPRLANPTSTATASRSKKAASSTKDKETVDATKAKSKALVKRSQTTAKNAEESTLAIDAKPKTSRARKAAPAPSAIESSAPETNSCSSRARRTASVEPEPSVLASTSSRSRSTRARSTAEPEEQAQPQVDSSTTATITKTTTRNRSTSSRTKKNAIPEEHVAETEEKPKATRAKKALAQIDEQPMVEAPAKEKKSTASRGRKATASTETAKETAVMTKQATLSSSATASALTRTRIPTSATTAPKLTESKSAPTRRGRGNTVEEKENDESQLVVEERKTVSAPTRKRVISSSTGVNKEEHAASMVVGRATRSRK
ncbi:hypothetical protein IAR55_006101 [Kwoniella newhampshirensis]|uniref:FHA domain-containing protein n=1 Tax=Kwoniella newhampshirensis TaxID=1651941 RepID=A0AAW0YXM9_9TREE